MLPSSKQIEKQAKIDYKDREYDSDDDIRAQMMTYDDRLSIINKIDHMNFKNLQAKNDKLFTDTAQVKTTTNNELPIIMHEREIMENIENFVVTIVCGETGSGKSTQIP